MLCVGFQPPTALKIHRMATCQIRAITILPNIADVDLHVAVENLACER
jgi:hypothetical protein